MVVMVIDSAVRRYVCAQFVSYQQGNNEAPRYCHGARQQDAQCRPLHTTVEMQEVERDLSAMVTVHGTQPPL